jgi:hypothetical protein
MVEALLADGADEALGERVRTSDRTGVRIASMPIEENTSSKLLVNFASRSRRRKRKRRSESSRWAAKLRAT